MPAATPVEVKPAAQQKPANAPPVTRPDAESIRPTMPIRTDQTVMNAAPAPAKDSKPAAVVPPLPGDHKPPAPPRPAPIVPAAAAPALPAVRPAAAPLLPDEVRLPPSPSPDWTRPAATPLIPDDQLPAAAAALPANPAQPAARPLLPDEPAPKAAPLVIGGAARPLVPDEAARTPVVGARPAEPSKPRPVEATPTRPTPPKTVETTPIRPSPARPVEATPTPPVRPTPPPPQRADNRPRGPRIEDTPPPPTRSKAVNLDEIRWPNTPPPHLVPNRPSWKPGERPDEGADELVSFDEPYRGPRIDFGDESRIGRGGPDPESIIDLSEFESEGDSKVARYSGIPTMPGEEPLFTDAEAAFGNVHADGTDVPSFRSSSEVIYGDLDPNADPSSAHLASHLEMDDDVPGLPPEPPAEEEPILAEAADDEDVPYAAIDTESEIVELATPPESFENAENRRTHQRLETDLDALCETFGRLEMRWSAKVRDVSRGGLQIVTERRFESGTVLSIQIPGLGDYVPTLLVRVMRVTREDNGLWSLGCKFAREMNERDVATLCGG